MPVALVTGAARANGIAAGIVPRLAADGWDVATSDLEGADHPCDLAQASAATALVEAVRRDRGPISALVLSHAHDAESELLDTSAEQFDAHMATKAPSVGQARHAAGHRGGRGLPRRRRGPLDLGAAGAGGRRLLRALLRSGAAARVRRDWSEQGGAAHPGRLLAGGEVRFAA